MRCAPAALIAVLGCSKPSYHYEPRPQLPPPATAAETCYRDGRIELVAARVDWARHYTSGSSTSSTPGGGIAYTHGVGVSQFFSKGGVIALLEGRRLDARAALRQIEDPDLTRDYEEILGRTARGHTMNPVWRASSVVLVSVGSAVTLGGGAWLLATAGDESNTPAYVTLAGLGVLTVSLIPAVLAYLTTDDAIQHERETRMFSDPFYVPRVAEGALRHNQRVAERCAAGPADVPMTPAVKRALGRE